MRKQQLFPAIEKPVIFTSEGAQLVGMLHQVDSNKIVIMCHGFTGNKIEHGRLYVEAARDFASRGYNAFRFDFYGSGDSQGKFEDTLISRNIANLKDAIAWARDQGYEHIAVLGISLGAATAILTILHQPVDVLVTWSAVPDMNLLYESHVNELKKNEAGQMIEYKGWPLQRHFFEDAVQYDIQGALALLCLPKFIVQGTADDPVFVDGFYAFRDIVQPPTDFMEIPQAGHTFDTPVHRRQVIIQTTFWLQRHF